jgi:hypothetical protein
MPKEICTCTLNLYTVCINAGLQCAVCTRAIHTNSTIITNLFEKCVGPEKGRLLQLGYRRSTSLVEYVAIQLLRLNRRAFLTLL